MFAAAQPSGGTTVGGVILILFIVIVSAALYFLPTFIAWFRHMPNLGGILIINLLLGWSVIGWIIALVMACSQRQQQPAMYPPSYGYGRPPYGPYGVQPGPDQPPMQGPPYGVQQAPPPTQGQVEQRSGEWHDTPRQG